MVMKLQTKILIFLFPSARQMALFSHKNTVSEVLPIWLKPNELFRWPLQHTAHSRVRSRFKSQSTQFRLRIPFILHLYIRVGLFFSGLR